jgi:hypothetical protein
MTTGHEITALQYGPLAGHECDNDGPFLWGGENECGQIWIGPNTHENRSRYTWGSVSCAQCGVTSIERGVLRLWQN